MDTAYILKIEGLELKIRVVILEALEGLKALPYGDLQKNLSQFDRTTVYRTLLALMDKGLIHKALEENRELLCTLLYIKSTQPQSCTL